MNNDLMELRQLVIAHCYGWRQMHIPAVNDRARDPYEAPQQRHAPYAPAPFAAERRPQVRRQASLWRLPTDLPDSLCSVAACLAGEGPAQPLTALQKLALLLKYAGAPLRWEPFNDYRLHRGISSPRSLFTCEIHVVRHRAGTPVQIYRYLPDYHALAVMDDADLAAGAGAFAGDGYTLVLVGQLDRLVRPYGELVPSLMGPEAGLLNAQVALLARAVGWDSATRAAFDAAAMRRTLGLAHWSRFPMALVALGSADVAGLEELAELAELAPAALEEQTIVESHPEYEAVERVAQLQRVAELSSLAGEGQLADAAARIGQRLRARQPGAARPESAAMQDDVLAVIRRRTAGVFISGCTPRGDGFSRATLDGIAALWSGLHNLQPRSDVKAVSVRAYLTVLRGNDAPAGLYEISLADGSLQLRQAGDLGSGLARAGGPMMNYSELNLVVSLAVDYAAELAALGPRAYLLVQQAVGEAAHQFALAAARHHMFSRMYKSFESRKVERNLNLPGQIVLQIMSGANRCHNAAFELL